jgi:hypothetical protein
MILGLVLAAAALAGPPKLVNYQGVLTDDDELPLQGSYDLLFKVYADSGAGADTLWSELHPSTSLDDGLFNVILGSRKTIEYDLFSNEERWLGITVAGDSEISPRMRFTSVPWALRAAIADSALSGGGGGAGDGHSLDSDGGTYTDVVYVAPDGTVTMGVDRQMVVHPNGGVVVGEQSGALLDESPISSATAKPTGARSATSGGPMLQSSRTYSGSATARGQEQVMDSQDLASGTPPDSGLVVLGKVGIGTYGPSSDLEVAGVTETDALKIPTGALDGYVLTSDATGTATWQPNLGSRVPHVVYADQMPGETTGQKIKAAIDSLPSWGGIVDARGFHPDSIHVVDINMFETVDSNLHLLLGTGLFAISVPQICTPPADKMSIIIRGSGRNTEFKPMSDMTVLELHAGWPVYTVSDLYFNLNSTNSTALRMIEGFTNNQIERIYVDNNSPGAVATLIIANSPLDTFRDITVFGNSKLANAFHILDEGVRIDHAHIEGCNACVYVEVGFPTTITNSLLSGNMHALVCKTVNSTTFENNNCESNKGGHIKLIGNEPHFPTTRVSIRDNYFTGINSPATYAIYIENAIDVLIEGNRFQSYHPGGEAHTVVFGGNVYGVTLTGNSVANMTLEMPGYDDIPLQVNDVTATQTSNSGGFSGGATVDGELTVKSVMTIEPSTAPTDPSVGTMYMDVNTNKLMVYDGTSWKACW